MDLIKPKALGKGSTVGITMPTTFLPDSDLTKGIAVLEKMGFKTKVHPGHTLRDHCRAGTDEQRGQAVNDMFADPEIDGIICAAGGSAAMRTEAFLDYEIIRKNPKVFCGFSDITLLLHSIQQKAGLITFHGPVLSYLLNEDTLTLAHFAEVVAGNKVSIDFPQPQLMQKGTAKGRLVGGNMALLSTLMGTPDAPDFDNALLFIEDVGEAHFRLDRLLWHMNRAGKLENIAGVVIGEMAGAEQTVVRATGASYGITIWDSVMELFGDRKIPIVGNAPIGHGKTTLTLPIGVKATLRVANKNASLTLEEGATILNQQKEAV